MVKAKEGIGTKIKIVKQWLNSAEDSFAKDNAVRGHLDLMLAEAEMKHLRLGTTSVLQKKYRQLILLLAVCLIMPSAYWYFTKQEKIVNIVDKSITVERGLLNSEKNIKHQPIQAEVKQQPVLLETQERLETASREPQPEIRTEKTSELKTRFTEQEKQALVRQAQKGLQGYNKNIGGL